jgi:hypothetical protein
VKDERVPPPIETDAEGETLELDAATESALAEALRAAWAPRTLDPALNELLIEAALEDPLAPASEAEIVESERLRDALEGKGEHPDALLARALRTANTPAPLSNERANQLVPELSSPRRSSNVVYVAFGAVAATAMAAAAAAMLFLAPVEHEPAAATAVSVPNPTLAQSRSTTALFHEKFATEDTSGRIDRIAAVRARELRQNRYAQWGLR